MKSTVKVNKSKIVVKVEAIDECVGDVATCEICGDKRMGLDSMDALREGMRHQMKAHNRRYPWVE